MWRLDETRLIGRPLVRRAGGAVYSVSFGDDGRLLASAGRDGVIQLWRAPSLEPLRRIRAHDKEVFGVDFSPRGDALVSAGADGRVLLWRARDGRLIRELGTHEGAAMGVRFSADGSRIASSGVDGTVRLWSRRGGRALRLLRSDRSQFTDVRFSPDGSRLLVGQLAGGATLWQPSSGRTRRLVAARGAVWGISFSPDGSQVITGGVDRAVRSWNVAALARSPPTDGVPGALDSPRGHGAPVQAVALGPSGRLVVSGGRDGTVRLWDRDSGKQTRVLRGHEGAVRAVAVGPGGRTIASGGQDGLLRLWRIDRAAAPRKLRGDGTALLGVRFAAGGDLVAGTSAAGNVQLWDTRRGELLATLRGHRGAAYSPRFARGGRLIATGGSDHTVRLWRIQRRPRRGPSHHRLPTARGRTRRAAGAPARVTGRQLAVLRGHRGAVHGIAITADGRKILSAGADGTVRVWDRAHHTAKVLARREHRLYQLALDPGGTRLAISGSDKTARILSVRDGRQRRVLRGHRDEVRCVQFDPTGAFVVTGSKDTTVRLWRTADGTDLWRTELATRRRMLTARGWRAIETAATQSAPASLPAPLWLPADLANARQAALDASRRWLCAVGASGRLQLWDLRRRRTLFAAHTDEPAQLIAIPRGCVARIGGEAVRWRAAGQRARQETLARRVTVIGRGTRGVLIASGTRVLSLSGNTERELTVHRASRGATAITGNERALFVGYQDGGVYRIGLDGSPAPARRFDRPLSGPVQTLALGLARTLVAGYRRGDVALWDRTRGRRLLATRLHGAVTHLWSSGAQLYAASELADGLHWDLTLLTRSGCRLLREVWRQAPAIWSAGQAIAREPPRHHACRRERE